MQYSGFTAVLLLPLLMQSGQSQGLKCRYCKWYHQRDVCVEFGEENVSKYGCAILVTESTTTPNYLREIYTTTAAVRDNGDLRHEPAGPIQVAPRVNSGPMELDQLRSGTCFDRRDGCARLVSPELCQTFSCLRRMCKRTCNDCGF